MNIFSGSYRLPGLQFAVAVLVTLSAGCSTVGPAAIRGGRLAYNEAITTTNNQQILKIVIQDRYEEQGGLLAVSSVTANVSVTGSVGVQAGLGDEDNYAGNLVPFSGGFVYEENPTISYTPVAGAAYLRQVMAPIPIETLAQIVINLTGSRHSWNTLVSSVNGLDNPVFIYDDVKTDPGFERFVDIMAELGRLHRLHWVENPVQRGHFSILIDHPDEASTALLNELLLLCGLPAVEKKSVRTVIPVSLVWNGADHGSLGIVTRSIWELLQMLAAAVDVPGSDIESGTARPAARVNELGDELHIHYSDARPDRAYVEVPFRDGWFYIDERDLVTKRYFKVLASLWSNAIADATAASSAHPVLTVPVSK